MKTRPDRRIQGNPVADGWARATNEKSARNSKNVRNGPTVG